MHGPTTGEINFNVVSSFTQKNHRTGPVSFENSYRCIKFCNFRQFLGAFVKLFFFSFTISFITSVCSPVRLFAWNSSVPTGWIFVKLCIECLFENCPENLSSTKIVQEYRVLYMKTNIHFVSYLPRFHLEWEKFRTEFVKKTKTHFIFNFSENRAVSEIMWKNITEPGTAQMTIRRMRIECSTPKATNTH